MTVLTALPRLLNEEVLQLFRLSLTPSAGRRSRREKSQKEGEIVWEPALQFCKVSANCCCCFFSITASAASRVLDNKAVHTQSL